MATSGFWTPDWYLALVITLLMLMTISSTFVQSLERWAYDVGVRALGLEPSRPIAMVGIDDQSIANIGRWPWPRDVHATMIDRLARSGAKVVGYMSFFFKPQRDPGLQYIDRLNGVYHRLPMEKQGNVGETALVRVEAEDALNTARELSNSIASIASHYVAMAVRLMSSAMLLVVSHLAMVTKRFIVSERGEVRSDSESAESNRMLGLTLQGQKRLNMVSNKFRQAPVNESLVDNLYVVHRDIKPANCKRDVGTDSVKMTDCGIARITESSRTKTGMVLGTLPCMSPQQLPGAKVTGQSDLSSLGVTLYQLACRRLPVGSESMTQLMSKIPNEEAADIQSIDAAVLECLVKIIQRALAKDVPSRFQTGPEMAQALRDCRSVFVTVDVAL